MKNKILTRVKLMHEHFTIPRKKINTILLSGLLLFCSCQKTVDIGFPVNSVSSGSVFTTQSGVNSAIAGMYGNLYFNTTTNGYSLLFGLLADEMSYNGTMYQQYQNNSLVSNDTYAASAWAGYYAGIYQANAIIEGVAGGSLPDAAKDQATGEALFIRAFCYFYLVNLYGDVPLITTTVVQDNQLKPRTPSTQIYAQITADLVQAEALLPVAYPSVSNRTRVNKYAAAALLARVYLYQKNYVSAEAEATKVIGQSSTYTLPTDLAAVFLIPSTETIWCFDVSVNGYTNVGIQTIPNAGVIPNFAFLPGLLNAFEPGDKRKVNWIAVSVGQSYPYKYHTKTKLNLEDDVVLRLAEQYLIRAEARAQQNNLTGAQADINVIRTRAGLANTTAATQLPLLAAVYQERRVELFTEWGHRWFDLKRTGQVDAVIGALKPTFWHPFDALYPIPSSQIAVNFNLTQNPGYN